MAREDMEVHHQVGKVHHQRGAVRSLWANYLETCLRMSWCLFVKKYDSFTLILLSSSLVLLCQFLIFLFFRLQFGKIYEVRMMMDFNGNNRGYAFVTFSTKQEAKNALKHLNNYEIR